MLDMNDMLLKEISPSCGVNSKAETVIDGPEATIVGGTLEEGMHSWRWRGQS